MKKFFTMMMRQFSSSPIKMILTIVAVSLGAFILVLSFNITDIIQTQVEDQLDANGIIVHVANATWAADGELEQTMPMEWDSNIQSYLQTDTDSIEASAIVSRSMFFVFTYNGKTYDLRSSIATEESYFDIFNLQIIAGDAMTDEDVELGSRKVWISEETAILVFGSAQDAVGKWIQPPGQMMGRGMADREQVVAIQYKVAGVFETPSEISRKVYGISDLIVPYTSMLPSGMSTSIAKQMMSGTLVVKSNNSSFDETEQAISQVIYQNYGEDLDLAVWEGSLDGESTYMNDLRQTIQVFTVSVNILGLVLMLVSTLGIFSIMLVEALSRRRAICLERSLGATKKRIVKEFWSWSIAMSFLGVVIGSTIAYFTFPSVLQLISPLFGDLSNQLDYNVGFSFIALLKSVALILVFGGIFGVIPVLPIVRENIAEGLKEE